MRNKFGFGIRLTFAVLLCLALSSVCTAITSKITRHVSSSDLLKGQTKNVVIDSRGTIKLGRAADELIGDFDDFGDVWSINSVVNINGTVYFGTSPNGGIYKYELNKLTRIYPPQDNMPQLETGDDEDYVEMFEAEEHLSNEHIFAMTKDASGRLLAGISGKTCRLCRFENDGMEIIFETDDVKYIFAIAVDKSGNIFLGTGPEGKVFKLNPNGRNAQVIYDSPDKNILSLAVEQDGCIYAGSDTRGLVYKIDPRTRKTTVLYDSDQPEITSLLIASDMESGVSYNVCTGLYAAATSAKIVQAQTQFAASVYDGSSSGRPEAETENGSSIDQSEGSRNLQIANTEKPTENKPPQGPPQPVKRAKTAKASYIYNISKDGFVREVFGEAAIFFCLATQNGKLLVGTGNSGQLYSIDPALEEQAVIFEDKQASQITAMAVSGQDVFLGTANPAKLIKLTSGFASEGVYISDLIDAGQPSKWGKLQLEADIPRGCEVLMACRSGNVEDVNDPTFSDWSGLVEITEPVQLNCPLGRFCQYKLVLRSENGDKTPQIREIAVANTVPNLAPKVEAVTVAPISGPGKEGFLKISYKASDDNEDELIYRIDFRKIGRTNWIELKDQVDGSSFDWDGKTVEDGRYEIRVTASDEKNNTTATKLTGSRISQPVVVDNTGPAVMKMAVTPAFEGDERYQILKIEVWDELSAIGKLEYTIDSNTDWVASIPDDMVYDTTSENFTIQIEVNDKLSEGDHVLTIRVKDAVGNTTYKTLDFNID